MGTSIYLKTWHFWNFIFGKTDIKFTKEKGYVYLQEEKMFKKEAEIYGRGIFSRVLWHKTKKADFLEGVGSGVLPGFN